VSTVGGDLAPLTEAPPPPSPARRGEAAGAFARLLAAVLAIVAVAWALHGLAVLVVVAALVVMIMVHELGHFVTAKLSGMKVTEYFLGFGPRLWSVRHGETEYGVKAIPAGGYVRIIGMTTAEEIDPVDEPRSYREATFPRRVLVASAGSAMHFVMAFGLLVAMFVGPGFPTTAGTNEVTGLSTIQGSESPAELAGLKVGDDIIGVNGKKTSIDAAISAIESHPGKKLGLLVRHNGVDETVTVRPLDGRAVRVNVDGTESAARTGNHPVGFIGVELGGVAQVTTGVLDAFPRAGAALGTVTVTSFSGIASVFSLHGLSSFAHDVAHAGQHSATTSGGTAANTGEIVSILGAVQIGADAARHDISELLYLLVAINIFVSIANLFPMLPLDGGHVAIAIYERIRSRRGRHYHADVRKLMPVAYVFLLFMVILGLSALYLNARNPLSLPGG
jgi:membrane-associated protease RseP (regulator of RpoE activity)